MNSDLFPPENLLPADGEAVNHGCLVPEADLYLRRLLQETPWQPDVIRMFGKTITTTRKIAWFGDPGLHYTYSGTTKTPLRWTGLLEELKKITEAITDEKFNSCLLNLYHNGSEGMSWHRDNESSIVTDSTIACLSFGAKRRFQFKHTVTGERVTTELEHGSLLTMSGKIQTLWLHCLPKTTRTSESRISLTFRQMVTP